MSVLKASVTEATQHLLGFLERTQVEDGSWSVPYTGPNFLLPLCHHHLSDETSGLSEGPFPIRCRPASPTVGGRLRRTSRGVGPRSCLYKCDLLRRSSNLDEKPDRPELTRMRNWIHDSGTPVKAAAWGKFILSILNLYDWSGVTPVPPELYLLPSWVPVQPINISGYVRIVYLPMAYFYGRRWQAPLDPLLRDLRKELFPQGFDQIDWPKHRADLAPTDHIVPETLLVRLAMPIVRCLEKWIPPFIRRKALRLTYEHICYEDEQSDYIRQAPVNACYNTLAHFVEGQTDRVARSWQQLPDTFGIISTTSPAKASPHPKSGTQLSLCRA